MMQPAKRILILYTDAGGGHRAAAQALEEAFHARYGEKYEVILADGAQGAVWPVSEVPRLYYPAVTYSPWGWKGLFHATNTRVGGALVDNFISMTTRGMPRLLQERQPDLIVSVHPQMAQAAKAGLKRLGMVQPVVTVVTDLFDAHVTWYSTRVDLLIVPTDEVKRRALKRRFPGDRIRVVGLPISGKFAAISAESGRDDSAAQNALRKKLGLEPGLFTVLLTGGGEGFGHLEKLTRALANSRLPIQIAIIAGRNEKLKKKIESEIWKAPVHVTGFVTNMPEWMVASDLVITKAGPATIMEALACGRPIILNGFIPGQEKGNVDFVEQSGTGVLRRTPTAIVRQIRDWLKPGCIELETMRQRAQVEARPRAAQEIVELLADMLGR